MRKQVETKTHQIPCVHQPHDTSRDATVRTHTNQASGQASSPFHQHPNQTTTLQSNYSTPTKLSGAYLDTLLALKLQHLSPALLHIGSFRPQDRSQRLPTQHAHISCLAQTKTASSYRQIPIYSKQLRYVWSCPDTRQIRSTRQLQQVPRRLPAN